MTLKTSSACLLIILLASCASPAENVIPTPLVSLTPTATSAPSETPTPKPTETNTVSPTAEMSLKPLTVEELQNFDYQTGFGSQTISYDEMVKLANEPLNISPEDLASREPARFNFRDPEGGSLSGTLYCEMGINFFPQYATLVDINGIPYKVILTWVILEDKSGQNILKPVILDFDTSPDLYDRVEEYIRNMATYPTGIHVGFTTRDEDASDPYYDPLVGENQARTDFENGIINSDTLILWVRSMNGR